MAKFRRSTGGYEDQLLGFEGRPGLIESGRLSDADISFILKSGDRTLINALESKYRREKKNADHVERMYGSGFTNMDNDGNLYKDSDISSPVINPENSMQDVQRMQNILPQNL